MAQLIPAAIAAPRTARLGYRIAPERALTVACVVIGVAMLTTAAAIGLEQNPLAGHPLTSAAVGRGSPRAGTPEAGPQEDPADGRALERDPLALGEQVGQVAVVEPEIAGPGELDDPLGEGGIDGVPRTSAAVAMGESGDPLASIASLEALEVADRELEGERRLDRR